MLQGRRRFSAALLVAAVGLGAALGACSQAGSPAASPSPAGGIAVTGAWARPSMGMADAMATYLVVTNSGSAPDALVGAASDVAGTVQVHETVMVSPSPAASGMGMASPSGGMMAMRPIARVEVPAGGSLELKPGSYHIMLMGMKRQLKAGDTFTVTLTFEKAGPKTVTVEVRAS